MANSHKEDFVTLLGLLEDADTLQQRLLGDEQPTVSYRFHNLLDGMYDEVMEFAAANLRRRRALKK